MTWLEIIKKGEDDRKRIARLHLLHGKSMKEIAWILGINRKTVSYQWALARRVISAGTKWLLPTND